MDWSNGPLNLWTIFGLFLDYFLDCFWIISWAFLGPDPPKDPVIITSMRRSFWQNGEQKTGRLGNVDFHAKVSCVKRVPLQSIPFVVVIYSTGS